MRSFREDCREFGDICCSRSASALPIDVRVVDILADLFASGSFQVQPLSGNLKVDRHFESFHSGYSIQLPESFHYLVVGLFFGIVALGPNALGLSRPHSEKNILLCTL